MILLAGQLQFPRAELKVIPVAMQLHVVEVATVVAKLMEEQFTHLAFEPLPVMTRFVEEGQPHAFVKLVQLSFPAQIHDLLSLEGPTI